MKLTIYTDGGCEPNPGNGCWAFICIDPYIEVSGTDTNTTSNRMELIAILEAIKFGIESNATEIFIHSDSKYSVNAFNIWMEKWVKKGWKDKKNTDIFRELFQLKHSPKIKIKLIWIRGHNGNEYNEAVDQLVRNKYQSVFDGEMQY